MNNLQNWKIWILPLKWTTESALGVQCLRTHPAKQGTRVWSLVSEVRSHMPLANNPPCCNYWSLLDLEPVHGNSWVHTPQLENRCASLKDPAWHSEDSGSSNEDPMRPNKYILKKKKTTKYTQQRFLNLPLSLYFLPYFSITCLYCSFLIWQL